MYPSGELPKSLMPHQVWMMFQLFTGIIADVRAAVWDFLIPGKRT